MDRFTWWRVRAGKREGYPVTREVERALQFLDQGEQAQQARSWHA
ncbi:hypothetical protein [Cupriavidus basilensis]|uniref:Uncharacterized protein n=1 Tax=Cupriavidus basilensis TaxID=68895 RepID=A0A0C4YGF2_9BURK|nr:hypothetical protein [Cupriavidus basilensis]AJG19756.1 hypothetical protein RR42_m2364 [Cupriavidus basilensis]